MTRQELPAGFPSYPQHVSYSVLIAWALGLIRGPFRALLGFSQDLPIGPVPAARMITETPDDVECASLPETYRCADTAISEVMRPPLLLRSSLPLCSAFHGVADDREIILRSADRGARRSGG